MTHPAVGWHGLLEAEKGFVAECGRHCCSSSYRSGISIEYSRVLAIRCKLTCVGQVAERIGRQEQAGRGLQSARLIADWPMKINADWARRFLRLTRALRDPESRRRLALNQYCDAATCFADPLPGSEY